MLDQLSAKWLAHVESVQGLPNVSRLRASGVSFENAIVSNPVCCPSRATLATGLTSRQHGVLENGYQLDPSLPTFMRILQQAGWNTAAFGKLHFRPHAAGLWPNYQAYGFDQCEITEDMRGGSWLDWIEANHPDHFESALATVWQPQLPDFASYGPARRDLRTRIEAIRKEFCWATKEFPEGNAGAYPLPFPEELSQTSWITNHAIDFLSSTQGPFLAQISYVQPHGPYCAPPEDLRRISTESIPAPVPAEWLTDPHAPEYFQRQQPVEGNWRHARRCYFADLLHLDRQLGRILDLLDEKNLRQNTCVILVSDHGDLLYDHGFRGKEERHYDACIRVPLIVSGPGFSANQRCEELVQLEDVCPTILDLAAQPYPNPPTGSNDPSTKNSDPLLSGFSLRAIAEKTVGRSAAYCESYNSIHSNNPRDWARTIRTATHRYTWYPGGGEQLFDLIHDPDEQNNLAGSPESRSVKTELKDRLFELVVKQDFPKPRRDLFAFGVH